MVLIGARHTPIYPLGGLLLGGFVLTVLVFVRQLTAERDRRDLLAEYHRLASTDELTGLANRRRFFDLGTAIGHAAAARGEPVAVIMVDLDRFKAVNDHHGHAAGDEALRVAARAIQDRLGPQALVARFGGDEFVALVEGPQAQEAAAIAAAISGTEFAVVTDAAAVTVRITAGSATGDGRDLDALIREADAALYRQRADRVEGPATSAVRSGARRLSARVEAPGAGLPAVG